MSSLADLGIKKNWTYEAVITCFDGIVPHASPFGIRCPDNKIIQLEIYKGSNTLEYIMEKKDFVVNFVHNYEYFFNSGVVGCFNSRRYFY